MTKTRKVKGKLGKKGELFPPKSIHQKAGDVGIFEATEGSIRVQKVPSVREAFSQKKFAKISFKKFEEMTSEVLSSAA